MKKGIAVTVAALFLTVPMVFGQIVTNTNQSVQYLRLLSRNASTDIDAVYYNPAGAVFLENGFHLALHNQTIFQEKTVIDSFPFLNNDTYIGDVNVPIFPTFFAVYKMDKFALSFGFGPNSGGGTADFKTGLPSFEIPLSMLPMLVSSFGIPTTQYSADIAFKGTSVFYGFQVNAAYAFNDMFSVAAGVRYIYASNDYTGDLTNIMINPQHPLINPSGNMMSAAQFFTIINQPLYAAMVTDQSVDVKQTGSAWTPLLGLDIRPAENLNIGIRYEFNTNLELTNDTTVDDSGLFPDGYTFRNDIPAILSLGLEYGISPDLRVMVSYDMFFEKKANLNGNEKLLDSNSYDIGIGLEYDLTDTVSISAGYLRTQIGVSDEYQSDFSHELSANTVGFGGRIELMPKLDLDLGVLYVKYIDASRNMTIEEYPLGFTETYQRWTWAFAVGLGYHF
jgi:long-chain fatty acid transport protein